MRNVGDAGGMPKIVTFATLSSMPDGTIFSYLNDEQVRGLHRKDRIAPMNDKLTEFSETDIVAALPIPRSVSKESEPVIGLTHRWTVFDDYYSNEVVVYDAEDIAEMKSLLG